MKARLAEGGIRDERVLAAMERVPRHLFVPEALEADAHRNTPLPIGDGQTISAPDVVALMTEALELRGDESVLEIGTGSGYQAAVLAQLAARVFSIERIASLAQQAHRRLVRLGITNVVTIAGDGSGGYAPEAPYAAIAVTAGGPRIPEPLLRQLQIGGRLVGPFGPRSGQELVCIRKRSDGGFEREVIARCRFVDLVGAHGWPPPS